jgi:hypothetical protein
MTTALKASGAAPISFISRLMEDESKLTPDEVDDIKYTASSLYGGRSCSQLSWKSLKFASGGADTIVSAQTAFFLAMILYPGMIFTPS